VLQDAAKQQMPLLLFVVPTPPHASLEGHIFKLIQQQQLAIRLYKCLYHLI